MIGGLPVTGGWRFEHEIGPAARLHRHSVDALGAERIVRILEAEAPALVLGSSQPDGRLDTGLVDRLGFDVVRRRTGGGAVLVGPGRAIWVDFVVPAGDPLWDDDVRRAAWWVGEVWADALADWGVHRTEVWRDGMVAGPLSADLCFAGLGPGEVRVGRRKAVGVSQRRTRFSSLFQTAVLLEWDAELMVRLFSRPAADGVSLRDAVFVLPATGSSPVVAALERRLMP